MSDGQNKGPGKPFKFSCPACGQHIQGDEDWSGRQINCPSCGKPIIVPPPLKSPPAETATTKPKPVAPPTAETKTGSQQPDPTPSKPEASPTAANLEPAAKTEATVASPSPARVAVITPAIKLEMVRSVRKRIANESSWLPGRVKDVNAYAAKVSNGETILVDVESPEATRFSLIGAYLLEFQLRNVIQTAAGRTQLLDQEIPDAVREALLNEMSDEEREKIDDSTVSNDPMSISHAQCLAALDALEDHYSQRIDNERIEKAKRKLGNTRLPDLVKKLENKARIAPEDVATALYHELMDVRRKLDRLESRIDATK